MKEGAFKDQPVYLSIYMQVFGLWQKNKDDGVILSATESTTTPQQLVEEEAVVGWRVKVK